LDSNSRKVLVEMDFFNLIPILFTWTTCKFYKLLKLQLHDLHHFKEVECEELVQLEQSAAG